MYVVFLFVGDESIALVEAEPRHAHGKFGNREASFSPRLGNTSKSFPNEESRQLDWQLSCQDLHAGRWQCPHP